ncbi:MAG TPA: di-heme oxidoredictase family protein [Myxococcales bacterium]|nr:di-heme oxidoredictase family protein [Myxococcales bacterium]
MRAQSCRFFSVIIALGAGAALAQTDPGPRGGPAGAGGPLAGLGPDEVSTFNAAREVFAEIDSVSGGIAGEEGRGLGPTFNANSCATCHAQPAAGGSSPHPRLGQVRVDNPQVALATLDRLAGQRQAVPSFIAADGPVREARFVRNPDGSLDGGVHGLYTIAGRIDAPSSCALAQPDFAGELARGNVIFRIPTPTFGLGLVENTPDPALIAALRSTAAARARLGIGGRFNTSGNDGSITRFGWKAQNKSLVIFAGEAYNVEQGVTNELFPNERGGMPACEANPTPEDHGRIRSEASGALSGTLTEMSSDAVSFANFMRLSAPPASTTGTFSELNGRFLFKAIGCALCHTQTLVSRASIYPNQTAVEYHPYSDFALHHMGPGLADFVSQGGAGPDEFRTAPLWGVGQRIFFLHDGRAGPDNGGLARAISQHASSARCAAGQQFTDDGVACRSEANAVIARYNSLAAWQKQDVLEFLRSL